MGQPPTEFTLEAVRQLMLARGGRVTNHELVKSFKRWLTDPSLKEEARIQFKDYVNTLATIKQEHGEKYLVLKKKFYPEYYQNSPKPHFQEFYTNNPETLYSPDYGRGGGGGEYGRGAGEGVSRLEGSPSLLDEVMAGFNPPSRTLARSQPSSLDAQLASQPTVPNFTLGNGPQSLGSYQGNTKSNPYTQDNRRLEKEGGRINQYIPQTQDTRYDRQSSQDLRYDRQSSQDLRYDRQSSQDVRYDRQSSQDVRYDRQSSQDLRYDRQSSQDLIYDRQSSQDLRYDGQSSQDLKYDRPASQNVRYDRQHSQDLQTSQFISPPVFQDPGEDVYNPGAFSPHFAPSSRQSVSSFTSQQSSGSYNGSPRSSFAKSSYASGSSRSSIAGGVGTTSPRSSLAHTGLLYQDTRPGVQYPGLPPPGQQYPGLPQPGPPYNQGFNPEGRKGPPSVYSGGSPRGSISQPSPAAYVSPRGSMSQPPSDYISPPDQYLDRRQPDKRPPPYRPPPIDPEPPSLERRAVPPVNGLPGMYERPTRLDLGLPPPPPRQDFDLNPPPLPRRPVPQSRDIIPENLGIPVKPKSLLDSMASASLSKSYGNLTVDENKENMRMEGSQSVDNLTKEQEKISVRERTKTFNRMASETEISGISGSTTRLSSVKRRNSRAVDIGSRRSSAVSRDDESHDSASITTLDPTIKSWMVQVSKGDYQSAAKMLMEEPKLARNKDFTSGYTGLHWACKYGNLDMVKLLAGTYHANVNARSHGGYTPLHIAAQHGQQQAFDLLVQAYKADANLRDFAGKRARQYMMQSDTSTISLSNHTFRQLKDRRRTRTSRLEKNQGMLRFGSLSVKVKKTTEAFNNYFNNNPATATSGGTTADKKWDPEDLIKMPPPKFVPIKKRKSKRTIDFSASRSAPVTPVGRSPAKDIIPELDEKGSDSDTEFGFGSRWSNV